MRHHPPTLSRRSLLVASALVAAGCTSHSSPHRTPPTADPDADALAGARDSERMLLASYDAAIDAASAARKPALLAGRATHAVHLAALHGGVSAATGTAVATNLRRAELSSATSLRAAASAARAGTTAALLASIAASHAAG